MITSSLPRTVAQDAAGSHTIRPGPETVARLSPQLSNPPVVSGISPVEVNRALALPDANATDQERLVVQHNILTNKIQALLSQQPQFKSFMDEQLGQAFGLRPPLNTESVYFHRYRTDADGQRTQQSCERLSEMLFKAIQALKAEPRGPEMQRRDDAQEFESGFYPTAAAAESDKKLDTFTPLRSVARRIETQLPQSLGHFWSASHPDAPRQDQLLDLHRALLSTQAALRVQDGTLSRAGKQLIDQAFQHPTLAQREQVIADGERAGVYPITLNDDSSTPALLAGAFMITHSDGSSAAQPFQPNADRSLAADAQHGPVVLYTPGEGFEEFATPADVLDTLRRRISTDFDAADMLMQSLPLSTQANLEADWGKHLSPRFNPLAADVVAAGLQQLLERQQQQTRAALDDLFDPQMPVVSVDPLRRPQTLQALHKASDLAPHFDGCHAMAVRAEKLLHLLESESTQAGNAPVVAQDKPLKTVLADNHNLENLARQLHAVAKDLAQNAGPEAVSQALKTTHMDVHPDASSASLTNAAAQNTVSLEAFVSANGLHLPTTKNQMLYLADAVAMRAAQHPFGDFGGGLSWPIPLSTEHQRDIGSFLESNRTGLPGFPAAEPRTGTLDYLLGGTTLGSTELQNPAKAIEKLVTSARGQALGAAIQARLGGIPTNNSVNDYVLTAINVGLDQASIDSPRRNRVAGMDLSEPRHWGKPATSLVNELGKHLVNSRKASAASAPLASHLLLARVAPQFLVKDIPPSVVYGSQAWANFSMAVAKIEADAPGAATSMTFAQVMKAFDESGISAPPSAQKAALLDWAWPRRLL